MQKEIESVGLTVQSSNRAGVFFEGSQDKVIQFVRKSRFSSKVSLQLFYGKCSSADDLYRIAKNLDWETFLKERISFRIDSVTKDSLSNSQFALLKTKDAILDRFREKKIPLPEISKRNADVSILLRSHNDHCSIEVSLTGEPLGRRKYRVDPGVAPIRETLAQAVLSFSNRSLLLLDPFCGVGTLCIEEALVQKRELGLNDDVLSQSIVFQKLFPTWKISQDNSPPSSPMIFGWDRDTNQIHKARMHSEEADVEDWIAWEERDFVESGFDFKEPIRVVTNPPYGIRTDESLGRESFFQLGKYAKNLPSGSELTVITGNSALLGKLKLKASDTLSIKHSNLKAKIAHYEIKRPTT